MNYCVLRKTLLIRKNLNIRQTENLNIYKNTLFLAKLEAHLKKHAIFPHTHTQLNLKLTLAAFRNSSSKSAFPFPMRAEAMS